MMTSDSADPLQMFAAALIEIVPLLRAAAAFAEANDLGEQADQLRQAELTLSIPPEDAMRLDDAERAERGRLTLLRAARLVRDTIRAVRALVVAREGVLQALLIELRGRLATVESSTEAFESRRSQFRVFSNEQIERAQKRSRTKIERVFNELTLAIPGWAEKYEMTQPLTLQDVPHLLSAADRVINEVVGHVNNHAKETLDNWFSSSLKPILTEATRELHELIQEQYAAEAQQVSMTEIAWDDFGTSITDVLIAPLTEKIGEINKTAAVSGTVGKLGSLAMNPRRISELHIQIQRRIGEQMGKTLDTIREEQITKTLAWISDSMRSVCTTPIEELYAHELQELATARSALQAQLDGSEEAKFQAFRESIQTQTDLLVNDLYDFTDTYLIPDE